MEDMIALLKRLEAETGEDLSHVIARVRQQPRKYGIAFEEHAEDVDAFLGTHMPVFEEDAALVINPGSKRGNVLIEGDNLPALHALEAAGKKVDVIYIDPPYNTGNEFIYNDRMVGKDDAYRHSKWLSFMSRRLKAARGLLNDDGIIFVSIDDNEQAQLKLLMDEIFGEDNFVANVVVESGNPNGPKVTHKDKAIFKVKEYLLIYRKAPGDHRIVPQYDLTDDYDWKYNSVVHDGRHMTVKALMRELNMKESDVIKLAADSDMFVYRSMSDYKDKTPKFHQFITDGHAGAPLYDFEDFSIYVVKTSHDTDLYLKSFKGEARVEMIVPLANKLQHGMIAKLRGDLWKGFYREYGNVGREGGVDFKNGKKALKLIKDIISIHPNKDAVVLDFFAGSGTTGHAVLELNAEDGGDRRFILVTNNEGEVDRKNDTFNPERGICRRVTRTRLKNAITGDYGKGHAGHDAGLSYYRVHHQKVPIPPDMDYDDGTLRGHIISSIRILHHLSGGRRAADGYHVLTNCSAQHHVFFGDYVTDDVRDAALEDGFRHIIYVAPHLTGDEALERFDEVKSWDRFLR